jgi:hypothetical protein
MMIITTLVHAGEENRAIRETHMNQSSSRSHSLFQLVVEQTQAQKGTDPPRVLRSKFNLVDLAGGLGGGGGDEDDEDDGDDDDEDDDDDDHDDGT